MKLPRMKCALVPALLVCLIAHPTTAQVNDLAPLSDEFNSAATLANFQRIHQVEGWGADKLEVLDINNSTPGRLVMIPYTSSWYQDYVGELTFKSVTGDFVITTATIPRNRAQTGPPGSEYSLSGIMVRAPSGLTTGAAGWQTGQQNYVFLSHGAASAPGTYQYEVKTTQNSISTLYVSNGAPAEAEIQVARLGSTFIMLRRDGAGPWQVHRRYSRPDFPPTLQAGLTVYTDWGGVQAVYPFGQELQHNSTVITGQNPDLRAEFEYLRYNRPQIPPNLAGRDFSNPAQVSDAELLGFLGANAGQPAGAPFITFQPRGQTNAIGSPAVFVVAATGDAPLSYQWRRNGVDIAGATSAIYTIPSATTNDAGAYSVVIANNAGSVTSAAATLSVVAGSNPQGPVDYELAANTYQLVISTTQDDPQNGISQTNVTYTLSIPHRRGFEMPVVRGIVVGAPGRSGSIGPASPSWHRWLWDRQFVWVGISTHGTPVSTLTNALAQFATLRNRPELIHAPVCIHGISMGGAFTYDFAATYPERTIAFLPHHMYTPATAQTPAFLEVPGLFTQGEFDAETVSTHQWKFYEDGRLQSARWSMWIDWGHNHLARNYLSELAQEFFDTCIALRYPAQANPLLGPVQLNALPEAGGWLGEHIHGRVKTAMVPGLSVPGGGGNPNFWRDFDTDCAHIAPYAVFDRAPKNEHSWFPNERLACVWRSHVSTGFRTVSLQLHDLSGQVNYFGGTDYPDHTFTAGQTIDATVDARGFPGAMRVEFYDGATRMGEINSAPFIFAYPLANPGVHTLWALVTGADGQQRVTGHRAVNVRANANAANTAPTISKISNQITATPGASFSLPFTVGDAETAPGNLTVLFLTRFSGPNWVSSSSITGTGANRTLNVTLNPANTGVYGGLVIVSDGNLSVNEYIEVEVRDTTTPSLLVESGLGWTMFHAQGVWSAPHSLRLADENTPLENLTVTAVSGNQAVLPNSNIVLSGFGEYRAITYRAISNGQANITVTVSDGSASVQGSFVVAGLPAMTNTAPAISDLPHRTATNGVPSGPHVFRISDLHTVNDQLLVTAVSDNQAVLPDGNISLGTRGRDRTITMTPVGGGTATVTVTVSDGALSGSDTFQVTVSGGPVTPPSISTPPQSQTVNAGANVTFSVTASGSTPLSYQWRKNGANISGATGSSFTLNNVSASDAADYTVVVSNSAGSATSTVATLTVNPPVTPPSITTPPLNQTAIVGDTVTFNVVASGTPPLSYQWQQNGTNLAGATASSLARNNVTTNDAGSYTVVVSNSGGSVSAAATLTVHPINVTFTNLNLTPLPELGTNQYRGFVGGLYPNSANTRPAAHESLGRQLAAQQVRPRDAAGSVDPANGRIVLLSIGMSNTSMEFAAGSDGVAAVSFRNRANADPSKNPQLILVDGAQGGQVGPNWTNAFTGPWTNIPTRLANAGVNSNQVQVLWIKLAVAAPNTLGGAGPPGSGAFPAHALMLESNLVDTIRAAQATFPNLAMIYLSSRTRAYVTNAIGLNPEPFAYESGFSVKWLIERQLGGELNADPANGPVTTPWLSWGPYLWADGTRGRSDGFIWESSDVFQTDFTHPSASGVRKVADQLLAFFKTDPTATPWFLRSTVTGQPPVCAPTASTTNGLPPLTVQFAANASDPDGALANIWWTFEDGTFATNSNPVKRFDVPGVYTARVTATDNSGNPVTGSVTITVGETALPPSITTPPQSQTVNAGANVTFSVSASGTAPLSYQWRKAGTNISGATGSSFTLNNVSSADAADYTVFVSNSAGSITSAPATLTVTLPPAISLPPQSQTVSAGASVTFSVTAPGTAPLSYQWRKDGTNISGATGASLTLISVLAADAGDYSVVVSNSAGSATSVAATLTVNTPAMPPAISTHPQSQTVAAGATVTFNVIASGAAPLSYQWRRNGAPISGANATSYTIASVQSADAGTYDVVVSNGGGSVTSNPAALTVAANNPAPAPVLGTNSPADITIGTLVVAPDPQRFGVNLREPSELNNFTGDPGFEPTTIRRQHRATGGGANYIVNDASVQYSPTTSHFNTLQDGFFDGAHVRVYRPSTNGGPLQFVRAGIVTNYVTDGFRRLNALPITVSAFTDTNATPGVQYEYQVRAVNTSETSSTNFSGEVIVSATPLPGSTGAAPSPVFTGSFYGQNPPPPVPANLTATPLAGAVQLDWSDATAPGLAGYYVYRRSIPTNELYRVWLNTNGPPVQAGDIYFLEMTVDNAPVQFMHDRLGASRQNDAWRVIGGTFWPYGMPGTVRRDSSTVPPENGGVTSLRIDNPGAHEVSIRQARFSAPQFYAGFYPHLEPGRTYRVDVWLKQTGVPNGLVRFFLSQHYSSVQTNFTVGANWEKFTCLFTAPPLGTNATISEICLGFNGPGTVWVDNFLLYEDADGDPATYPAFALRPAVAQALADYQPGVVRIFTGVDTEYWGVTMDDWTRAELETTLHWEANTGRRTPDDPYKLPTALRMMRDCGGEPWLVVGSFMTEQEWLDLMEYLAAPYDPATDTPASKPYAYRRYAQGQHAPWTDVFPRWFIEYGNELWNPAFQWNFPNGNLTGQFTEHFFTVAKSSPWFAGVADKINFVANGWLVSPDPVNGYGHAASLASPSSHYNDIAVYIGGWEAGIAVGGAEVNDEGYQDYLLYAPSFIRYYMDQHAASRAANAAAGHPYRLAIYEGGPGYANPSPGQPFEPISETYGKSLAAAVATLDTYLYNSLLDIDPQAYFTFAPGYNWSTHSPVVNGYHPHANWLALQMRNRHVTGAMVATHLNAAPTINVPPHVNGAGQVQVPAYNDVPLVAPYAFRDGDKYSVFILSRSISNATPVTLRLPFTSVTNATLHKFTGDPRTNNVTHLTLFPTSEPVNDFAPNYSFTLPPGSVYLFVFEGATTPVQNAPVPTISLAVGQGETSTVPAVAFNVFFNQPVTGFTTNSVQIGGTAGATRVTITEVSPFNGTTYQVIVSGMTSPGTVTLDVPAGAATGTNGLSSAAATILNNTVQFSFPQPQDVLLAYDDFNVALTNSLHFLNGVNSGASWANAWLAQNFNPTNGYDGYKLGTNAPPAFADLVTTGAYAIGGRGYEFSFRDLDVNAFGPFRVYGANPPTIGQDGTTLWASFLLRKETDDLGPVNVSLVNTNGLQSYGQINIGAGFYGAFSTVNGTRYWALAVRNAANDGADIIPTSVPVVIGQTTLLVLEMRFGAQDTLRLYVNPPLTGAPPAAPSASVITTGTADIAFRNVRFYAGLGSGLFTGDGLNRGVLDELRFGDSFLAVTPSAAPQVIAPSITQPPQSIVAIAGDNVTFSVSAAGTAPLSFQWRRNTVVLPGATNASLALNAVQIADAGDYDVVVSNSAGSVTSAAATLTVLIPPAVTIHPQSQTVNAGASVTFTVTATGTAPLGYQWRRNSVDLPGATAATLVLNNVQGTDAGSYNVVVSNSAGSVTSNPAALTVNTPVPPPTITTHPVSMAITAAGSVTFSVSATGPGLAYQWRFNGADIPGATSPAYTVAVNDTAQLGSYTVVVSNAGGSVTSNPAALILITPQIFAGITLEGPVGTTFRIEYTTNLGEPATWNTLTNVTLQTPVHEFVDLASKQQPRRFYRVVAP
ncbi:MAG: immunoglobulin domain-containing protein [Verrucomicrobiota bacterium]